MLLYGVTNYLMAVTIGLPTKLGHYGCPVEVKSADGSLG